MEIMNFESILIQKSVISIHCLILCLPVEQEEGRALAILTIKKRFSTADYSVSTLESNVYGLCMYSGI